jgi:hypothetical protein
VANPQPTKCLERVGRLMMERAGKPSACVRQWSANGRNPRPSEGILKEDPLRVPHVRAGPLGHLFLLIAAVGASAGCFLLEIPSGRADCGMPLVLVNRTDAPVDVLITYQHRYTPAFQNHSLAWLGPVSVPQQASWAPFDSVTLNFRSTGQTEQLRLPSGTAFLVENRLVPCSNHRGTLNFGIVEGLEVITAKGRRERWSEKDFHSVFAQRAAGLWLHEVRN